jgi:serine/threonine-protein kinase
MSPEQVRGRAAEEPSDIFSFGCVLYEMIAGRRAFARETSVQTMTDILERDPAPLSESAKDVPEGLKRLVARCLEKNAEKRIQSARDLALALRG